MTPLHDPSTPAATALPTGAPDSQGTLQPRSIAHALALASRKIGHAISHEAISSCFINTLGQSPQESADETLQFIAQRFGIAIEPLDAPELETITTGDALFAPSSDLDGSLVAEMGEDGHYLLSCFGQEGLLREIQAKALPRKIRWYRVSLAVQQGTEAAPPNWIRNAITQERSRYTKVAQAALLINFFSLVIPLFSMAVYDRVAPNAAYSTLWTLSLGVIIIILFDVVIRQVRAHIVDVAARHIDINVSQQLFEHLLGLALGRAQKQAGTLADKLRSFQTVQEFITSATLLIVIDIPFVVLFTTIIFIIDSQLGWLIVLMAPIMIGTGWIIQLPMAKLAKKAIASSHERQGTLVETIGGLETIRAVGAERQIRQRWREQLAISAISSSQTRFLSNFAATSAYLCTQLSTILMTIAGVYLIGEGHLTMGGLIAANMLAGRAISPLGQMSGLLARVWHVKLAAKDIADFAALPQHRPAGKHFMSRPNLGTDLCLENAEFAYELGQDQTPQIALRQINLKINRGETVAILGRNGSGKSTLLRVLAGLYPVQKGSMTLGGVSTSQIDPAELRTLIGYIPQDAVLLSGTVGQSVTAGWPDAPEQNILNAVDIAGASEFIAKLPDGFRYRLGERGSGLSTGQRQAITIAQALLRDPKILLMDEPTSAMDQVAEMRFIQRIRTWQQNDGQARTMVIVTHKPALLALADRIVIIDGGQIVADGSRQEILARLNAPQAPNQTP